MSENFHDLALKEKDIYKKNYYENVSKWKKKGVEVPDIKLIKTEEEINAIRKACKINSSILDYVAENIKIGMSTDDINTLVHNKTIELGGIPAPLNYEGFPKSVCTSVNDAVCHGIPSKDEILKSGDIINVDCTTIVDGKYGDSSRMFLLGDVSDVAKDLCKVTLESIELAISKLKPYSRLRDIGYHIERYCKKNGYSVVHEIGGHGVGNDFHEDPFVYHYGKENTGMVLFPGMVFTIEPMVNEKGRGVFLDAENEWTIYTDDGGLSAQWEYQVLITLDGIEILGK